ncbi:MAG: DUF3014 domain-containing protein [Polaromonas sp.]|uniref:DUF3014 domain-containing protein n=1 Tax=Polaromonas sp. TaxID=1869339 RepID=UPI002489BF24|nr:DUF3014 domain-containing protein [Polaromonas sp.]MDI1237592.1 DUF3014 domain-containing protein [Polaromonas sp.]MDI1340148.1 DUF3014 domain-containing protein [Polaromonas sp.]
MSTRSRLLFAAVLVAALATAALWWSSRTLAPAPTAARVAAAPAQAPVDEPAPSILHPITPSAAEPPLAASGIGAALTALMGQPAMANFLQVEDFPRRFVATVDNLGRAHAPPLLWPVLPTPGRFTVEEPAGGGSFIAADNSLRYAPLVALADSVSPARAVGLYIHMYPLLQQAYEELGYPKRYFNDRLIAVIDLLLATPEPAGPVPVRLTEVKGPIAPVRPWVRYEFADPALESLSSGQKIMLRVGPAHERRLKAKLAAFRQELLRTPTP